jgi:hypothetical protein
VQFRFWIPAYIFLFLLLDTSTFCHLTMIFSLGRKLLGKMQIMHKF